MIARFEALAREGRGNARSAAASTSPPAPRVSCVYFSLFGSGLAGLGQCTSNEVDGQVNLFAVSPLAAQLGERLVSARNPVVPEAAGGFPGCVGTVNKGRR